MRDFSVIAPLACAFLLAGCSGVPVVTTPGIQSGVTPGTALQGRVHGGQQPITGATVYLYAVAITGYGAASQLLLKSPGFVTTDVNGNFSIDNDFSCPAGAQVYVYSVGGNPGLSSGTNNTAAGLMAGLGPCSALNNSQFIWVNEVSTVATAYSLAGYATDATHISSSGNPLAATGVANAMNTITNLETLGTGVALAKTPAANGGNGTVPQSTIDTLANILAACINTTGASSTACSTLFSNARNGSVTPADTATAAINIAHNPGTNIANLFALQGSTPPFLPDLSIAPNDFAIAVSYAGGGTGCSLASVEGMAADAQGDIWVANNAGNSICEFNPTGGPEPAGAITGNGLSGPQQIAIDGNGYVWVTDITSSALSSFSSTGAAVTNTTSGGLNGPTAIAIDGSNNVWVTNLGVGVADLTKFTTSAGTPSAVTGDPFGNGVLGNPVAVAVDINGNAWVGDYGEIDEFSGSSPSTFSSYTGGGISSSNVPTSLAFDASGNVWVTYTISSSTASISEFNSTGGAISGSSGYTGGGLYQPEGVAIDSNGNAWVGNGSAGTISEFSPTGVALSPGRGFAYGNTFLGAAYNPVIDGSGNMWFTNYGASSFVEFVGLAAPVVTPMPANLQAPYASNKSAVNRP